MYSIMVSSVKAWESIGNGKSCFDEIQPLNHLLYTLPGLSQQTSSDENGLDGNTVL